MLTVVVVQLPPLDTLADEVLLAHMIQHIIIGEIASLFIVLGLTGPMLAPLLHFRVTRPLRVLVNPVVALVLWAVNLYVWHLPVLYQLAIRHDLVHALEHACLLWFGTLLWLAVLGPLPKPAWFEGWGSVGYVDGRALDRRGAGQRVHLGADGFLSDLRRERRAPRLEPGLRSEPRGRGDDDRAGDPHDDPARLAVFALREA